MRFHILTLFPDIFPGYVRSSLIGKAQTSGKISIHVHNIRDYATEKHRTTDDTPYGGGAGMIMKIEPIDRCLQAIKKVSSLREGSNATDEAISVSQAIASSPAAPRNDRVVVLSARGTQFTQRKAAEYSQLKQLILICGRYEGIDQRVVDYLAYEELSIGPYVLAGGEVAALAVLEATARLLPGVLGNPESLQEESFSSLPTSYKLQATSYLEYPQYTKPEDYKGWKVPKVLLSGDHAAIKKWREEQSRKIGNR